ncbi:MAG TPA: LemA family protein [Acidimicrobiia bacterium]|nr:LemA family protein [Acidimicrobiia bacterium]
MTAALGARAAAPKGRSLLLVVVALVVSALAASATAVALSSRSELASSRKRVDASWARLRPELDVRYQRLAEAGGVAREALRADRTLFGEIDTAVSQWPGTRTARTDRQVAAAAVLEGLIARLAATVATTPKLRASPAVTTAVQRLQATDTGPGRDAYNAAVSTYQRARGGFPRRLVAGALGYEDRRRLEVPI